MKNAYIVGGIVLGIAVIAGLILLPRWWGQQATPPPPPPKAAVEPEQIQPPPQITTVPAEAPPPPLPTLDESDAFVEEALAPMEIPQPWIGQGDLIRRLAVVVENASRGDYPRRQLAFLAPAGPFRVLEQSDGTLTMDPTSYARYDGYVDMLERMEPAQLAGLLDRVQPLLNQALLELGVAGAGEDLLDAAIEQLLAVPVIKEEVGLTQPNVLYEYADPALEQLTPLQKQMLRTGPDNVQRIQSYLRQLREAL